MRAVLLGVTILLTGCQSVVGPAQRRDLPGPVGAPDRPAAEQEARIRERLPFASGAPSVGPVTGYVNPLTRSGN